MPHGTASALLATDGPRFVEYFAESCGHCQHLAPIWTKAQHLWTSDPSNQHVDWVQKECYGAGWKPGKDSAECNAADIDGFPTMKFFGQGAAKNGDVYEGARSPDAMNDFVKAHLSSAKVASAPAAVVEMASFLAPQRRRAELTGAAFL